jgi:hypothetical protein
MSADKPPYKPGEIDQEALDHVVDQITNPATEQQRTRWEGILTKTRRQPWWRRVFARSPGRVVLPPPPFEAAAARLLVPQEEGFFAARHDAIDDDLVEDGPHGRFRTVEVKQMDPVKVATLG